MDGQTADAIPGGIGSRTQRIFQMVSFRTGGGGSGRLRLILIIILFLLFSWFSFPLDPISEFGTFNINVKVIAEGEGNGGRPAFPYDTAYHGHMKWDDHDHDRTDGSQRATGKRKAIIERCKYLDAVPQDINDSNIQAWLASAKRRQRSDRYESGRFERDDARISPTNKATPDEAPSRDRMSEKGTSVTVLRNATIWTGRDDGEEVIRGDIILGEGVVKDIIVDGLGEERRNRLSGMALEVVDVNGAWVTPGLVDLHSHIGVGSLPKLQGAADTNSHQAPILPFLRSIDGLNTHDLSYNLSISGGVTTAQVLPGSANNIGGQAFVIKLRKTEEGSVVSMVVEPPETLFNRTLTREPKWRHMKHACGENPDRRYSQSRMDAAWQFRNAYNEAKKIKDKQDDFCQRSLSSDVADEEEFPETPLETEALVDVLRGRVKISIHCYEAVDLDMIVRLSNEFKFPIASLHHAGETYLVPDVLKRAWGGTPAIALFAANARKKREAYRNSEFAPKILADNGVPVVMKSDHPVLNSRHLVYEAQQAHYYGLSSIRALQSVTTTPATAAGLAHRLGYISEGYDADIVIWDSHPLSLGATPRQVYVDGIPQLEAPSLVSKPTSSQRPPTTPDFSEEATETLEFDGLPPLRPKRTIEEGGGSVVFTNVASVYVREGERVRALPPSVGDDPVAYGSSDLWGTVVVRDGSIVCYERRRQGESACASSFDRHEDGILFVDLEGGSLVPGFTTFGSSIGLREIALEPSTNDGDIVYPFSETKGSLFGSKIDTPLRAKDGLQFNGRNCLLAYRGGVTQAIVAPSRSNYVLGFATAFSTGAKHALEKGAIVQNITALHIGVDMQQAASVGTQIAALRHHLLNAGRHKERGHPFRGLRRIVFHVDNADIMATLIALKREYHEVTGKSLPVTFAGAAEAHLLAEDIARENISIILAPSRPFPVEWDQRRILPGPPISSENQISYLMKKGINVALGSTDEFDARNARFDAGWAALVSGGYIDEAKAIELITVNLEKALGVAESNTDLAAFKGGSALGFESKLTAITSKRRKVIDLF